MKINVAKRSRIFGRMFVLVMALCILFNTVITANAATVNQAVTSAKDGVVQIQVWFNDPETASEETLHYGTGFLVNESTVVTCQHVVTAFPDDFYVKWGKETNRTAEEVKNCLELRVMLYRGTYVKAKLTNANPELDLAVLTLSQNIARTPLAVRNSDNLGQTEEVFAIGFPGDLLDLDDKKTYDIDDIAITSGNANKVGDMTFETVEGHLYDSVNCVESSARISSGNSGGPLVDDSGNVIGINAAGSDTRFIAVSSKELITYLTALNISFDLVDDDKPAPTDEPTTTDKPGDTETPGNSDAVDTSALSSAVAKAEKKKADDYTEDSYADLEKALKKAKDALESDKQSEIDSAADALVEAMNGLEEADVSANNNDNMFLILIIAIVAVFVIVIIIILVVVLKKKKTPQQSAPINPVQNRPAPATQARTQQTPAYRPPVQQPASETTVLSQGAGETTVLSQGAGETTVLSQQVNGGVLIRLSNNERIPISTAEFTVGRERTKVDYCVGGNGNISRVHARFVVRDGVTYVVDNNAANGTFVNGVKVRAGQETRLNSGDKILLADEKFEFNR